jgi:TrmH family RNA methyltransferase
MNKKTVISSVGNGRIKNLVQLQKKSKAREEQGVFVVEGWKMFDEAVKLGILIRAYVSDSFYHTKMRDNAKYFDDIDYEIVSDSIFKEVSETKTPQGILGTVKQPKYCLEHIIGADDAFLLLLEDIRDPGNLGTMIRTGEGAGISGIILNSSCVDVYNPKVIRSTMGSIYRVPFYQAEDFGSCLKKIKEKEIVIYAAHLMGKTYDTEGLFRGKCAFLIGNESNGLTERSASMADVRIKIPMAGKVESLNAAVAAAILMYEAARQKGE